MQDVTHSGCSELYYEALVFLVLITRANSKPFDYEALRSQNNMRNEYEGIPQL